VEAASENPPEDCPPDQNTPVITRKKVKNKVNNQRRYSIFSFKTNKIEFRNTLFKTPKRELNE